MTIIYPFMVLMIRDFNLSEDDRDIGTFNFIAHALI